eukprot:COSAG05_NODE_604_length_8399_cov_6.936145_11_plen_169_part_00
MLWFVVRIAEDAVDSAFDTDDPTAAMCDLVARLELPTPPPAIEPPLAPPPPMARPALDWHGPKAVDGTDQFLSFKLGQDKSVPLGMHEAVMTMEPGERSRIVLKAAKAFGGTDSPLPPLRLDAVKQPLQFEVELLWSSGREDVPGTGGAAERSVLTAGATPTPPTYCE